MRVAVYARVSTPDQNPQTQLQALRQYCQVRGWEIFEEFIDVGISGSTTCRPALDELIHAAGAQKFKAVLVWKFDRFGRSTPHLLEGLRFFQALGIDFVSVTEAIDTTTPIGRMVYTLLAAIAAFERDLAIERTKAGLNRARAAGKHVGRPRSTVTDSQIAEVLARDPRPSYRQAAKELGISAGQICKRLAATLKKAQDNLETPDTGSRLQ